MKKNNWGSSNIVDAFVGEVWRYQSYEGPHIFKEHAAMNKIVNLGGSLGLLGGPRPQHPAVSLSLVAILWAQQHQFISFHSLHLPWTCSVFTDYKDTASQETNIGRAPAEQAEQLLTKCSQLIVGNRVFVLNLGNPLTLICPTVKWFSFCLSDARTRKNLQKVTHFVNTKQIYQTL